MSVDSPETIQTIRGREGLLIPTVQPEEDEDGFGGVEEQTIHEFLESFWELNYEEPLPDSNYRAAIFLPPSETQPLTIVKAVRKRISQAEEAKLRPKIMRVDRVGETNYARGTTAFEVLTAPPETLGRRPLSFVRTEVENNSVYTWWDNLHPRFKWQGQYELPEELARNENGYVIPEAQADFLRMVLDKTVELLSEPGSS